ncbi:MAG: DUF1906 domain-containing protein [Clostridia bacterium]|nr:DUF1906 domain-containing protein [Clostridia bacterium]
MATRTGYDTVHQFATQNQLNALINDTHHSSKFFIGRYLKDFTSDHPKELIPGEVELISANGIDIVSIFQLCTYSDETKYTFDLGKTHANDAIERASGYHQPNNTPIYFALERAFDVPQEVLQCFKNYLDGIRFILSKSSMNPNGYKFGYYGPGYSGKVVKEWYPDSYIMIGNPKYNPFTSWNIKQQQPDFKIYYSTNGYFNVDIDITTSLDYGGWQYHQFPNSWSNYNNAYKHRRKCSICGRYEYQYHVPNAQGNRCTVCGYVGNIVVPVNKIGGPADETENS